MMPLAQYIATDGTQIETECYKELLEHLVVRSQAEEVDLLWKLAIASTAHGIKHIDMYIDVANKIVRRLSSFSERSMVVERLFSFLRVNCKAIKKLRGHPLTAVKKLTNFMHKRAAWFIRSLQYVEQLSSMEKESITMWTLAPKIFQQFTSNGKPRERPTEAADRIVKNLENIFLKAPRITHSAAKFIVWRSVILASENDFKTHASSFISTTTSQYVAQTIDTTSNQGERYQMCISVDENVPVLAIANATFFDDEFEVVLPKDGDFEVVSKKDRIWKCNYHWNGFQPSNLLRPMKSLTDNNKSVVYKWTRDQIEKVYKFMKKHIGKTLPEQCADSFVRHVLIHVRIQHLLQLGPISTSDAPHYAPFLIHCCLDIVRYHLQALENSGTPTGYRNEHRASAVSDIPDSEDDSEEDAIDSDPSHSVTNNKKNQIDFNSSSNLIKMKALENNFQKHIKQLMDARSTCHCYEVIGTMYPIHLFSSQASSAPKRKHASTKAESQSQIKKHKVSFIKNN
jgi:hypothetical protein